MKFSIKGIYGIVSLLLVMGFVSVEIAELTEDRPIALVRRFKPDVTITNSDFDKYITLKPGENLGEKLYSGDSLLTSAEGFALVYFMDKSIAKVKPNSTLIVTGDVGTKSKSSNTRISLNKGEIRLDVQPQGGNDFEVATNRSLASVKGTKFGSRSDGYVWVVEGHVDVTALNSGQTISLFDKMFAQVDDQGDDINSGTLDQAQINNLEKGYNELESNLIKKEVILRFRDKNGQIQEITIDVFEEGQE